MDVSIMASVAPVRFLGPIRALDVRGPRNLSSTSFVRRTSKTSLLFFIHHNRFPSLHSQSPNWRRGQTCIVSLKNIEEGEVPSLRDKWKKSTPTPKPKDKFTYPVRGKSSEPEFPWRKAIEDEPSNDGTNYSQKRRYGNSALDRQSDAEFSPDFNKNVFGRGDAQMRHSNSRYQKPGSFASNRRGDETGRAGGNYPMKKNKSSKPTTSRYPKHDSGRNMHRAPWESGAAQGKFRDRSLSPSMNRSLNERDVDEKEEFDFEDSRSSAETYSGGGRKSAMARIVEKLRAIGNDQSAISAGSNKSLPVPATSVFLPRPGQAAQSGLNGRWSNSDHPVPKQASDDLGQLTLDAKFPWDKNTHEEVNEEEGQVAKKQRVRSPSMAELTIPDFELKRLRTLGLQLQGRLKIGRLGVTPGIVEAIHERWRTCEIAKVKCDAPLSMNMKKAHEDLERLTGGLVIWRSGSAAVVYRGKDYVHPSVREREEREERERRKLLSLNLDEDEEREEQIDSTSTGNEEKEKPSNKVVTLHSTEEQSVDEAPLDSEREAYLKKQENDLRMVEEILDGLGPRYADWTGRRPVPVDGDLLLSSDFEFKRPFRLLPYGVKPKLNNFELTELRHLARPIPPHIVLGKNRGLDGVAAAIVKLWERSEIVKIGVKRGVQNTSNERMAEELKRLTGGTLLSRDKEFIVFHRGKDFLPPAVQAALEERDQMAKALQEEEERFRMGGRSRPVQVVEETSKVGTLEEALETRAKWEAWLDSDEARKERIAARKRKRAQATDRIRSKLNLALKKMERAQLELNKVEAKTTPANVTLDKEHLSDGERYMYRKLGLKMKAFLLLGRRGVFSGTVENMHLHWKYRELVKILVKTSLPEAERIAKILENESGGILVDIITTSKGQAIVMYRGKNYQRPSELRPRHLLTKRQALKRSLEMQRMESLEKHIRVLKKEIETMQAGLSKMEEEDDSESDNGSRSKLEDLDDADFAFDGFEYDGEFSRVKEKSGSYFRAEPLTRKQRHFLRQQIPLMMGKAANFNIGKETVYEDLAKSICAFLEKNPFVKIGVKGRPKGTSVASVVEQIEESTGAVLLDTEPSKLIFYRGWPPGEGRPDLAASRQEDEEEDEDTLTSDGRSATSSVSELEIKKDDVEDDDDEDDFGIDNWTEEDYDEDDNEDGEQEESLGHEEGMEGRWFSFSGEESDYTDSDGDDLIASSKRGNAAEQDTTDSEEGVGRLLSHEVT